LGKVFESSIHPPFSTQPKVVLQDYYGHFKFVMFKCDWFDPFVLSFQAQQCFYIKNLKIQIDNMIWKRFQEIYLT